MASLVVLNWNVAGLPARLWGRAENGQRYTPSILRKLVEEFSPDVICVQECFFKAHLRALDQVLPNFTRVEKSRCSRLLTSGLETWVHLRHAVRGCEEFTFVECAGEDCLATKGVLKTRIRLAGAEHKSVSVYNVHLQNDTHFLPSVFGAARAQRAQFARLMAIVSDDRANSVVVAGDLNLHYRRTAPRLLRWARMLKLEHGFRGDFCDVENTWMRSDHFSFISSDFIGIHPTVSDHSALVTFMY